MHLHLPFRERRARRVGELTLAAAVALSVIVTPGLIHGRGTRSNQAAAVATATPLTPPAPSTPSKLLLHHHRWTSSDAVRPRSVSDEQAFRHLWSTSPAFRMKVTYAHATPRRRAALRKFFHPAPHAKARAPRPAVVTPPAPRTVVVVPAVAGWTVWDSIAACESSGNWHDNTGNGYSGGLQFSPSTWIQYGGGQFSAYAWQASREQQIVVAERIHAAQGGYRAWPVCGSRA